MDTDPGFEQITKKIQGIFLIGMKNDKMTILINVQEAKLMGIQCIRILSFRIRQKGLLLFLIFT